MTYYRNNTRIEQALSRPDPLMSWRWVMAAELPFSNEIANGSMSTHYVESINLPFPLIESEKVHLGSRYFGFPKNHSVENVTIQFYADNTGICLAWLLHWQNKIKDMQTGLYGLPVEYKRSMAVALLDNRGNSVITATLKDCYPAGPSALDLGYDSSDRITFNVEFNVDAVIYNFDMLGVSFGNKAVGDVVKANLQQV